MRAIPPLSALSFGVLALLVNPTSGMTHSKGLYATEVEARQRAAEIGCDSVHENNCRWMPCTDAPDLLQQMLKQ